MQSLRRYSGRLSRSTLGLVMRMSFARFIAGYGGLRWACAAAAAQHGCCRRARPRGRLLRVPACRNRLRGWSEQLESLRPWPAASRLQRNMHRLQAARPDHRGAKRNVSQRRIDWLQRCGTVPDDTGIQSLVPTVRVALTLIIQLMSETCSDDRSLSHVSASPCKPTLPATAWLAACAGMVL